MNVIIRIVLIAMLSLVVGCNSVPIAKVDSSVAMPSGPKRTFGPDIDGRWIGNGLSYSAYRDGESPSEETITSKANILEDLQIIARRWNLVRLYGSGQQAQNILEVIRDNHLPIRVMQGVWLSRHNTEQENNQQLSHAIELANRFSDIIIAVNVGNEIFVDWSWHKLDDMDKVIEQIRHVRANIRQAVTVSDDYNFWNKPQARRLADELDFICMHAYAFWNNKTLDEALQWTDSIYRDIQKRHPQHMIAYCETGWPTSRVYADGSYEGGLIGKAGEIEQKRFFEQYNAWVNQNEVVSFYFTSFDEQWKGGFDGENPMAKAEKHWGLFNSNRTAKKALQ